MTRDAIEATVRAIYDARAAGNLDTMLAHFAPDAGYCVMGDCAASPLPAEHRGAALPAALTALNGTMPVRALRLASLMVDGERAVAEVVATLVFAPTGEVFDTHWVSLFTFRDGKVAEVAEYIDTARAAQLFASAAKG